MNTDDQHDGDDPPLKEAASRAIVRVVERIFSATIVGPAMAQIGLSIGDSIKYQRIKNLIEIDKKLDRICENEDIVRDSLNRLAFSVGMPLIEKASYQDDDNIQQMWASLMFSSMKNDEGEIDLTKTFTEILHQFTQTDCELLEYIVENGVEGWDSLKTKIFLRAIDPNDIICAFPNHHVRISLEKLAGLGCIYWSPRIPLAHTADSMHGSLQHDIIMTSIGHGLYAAATRRTPSWNDKIVLDNKDEK